MGFNAGCTSSQGKGSSTRGSDLTLAQPADLAAEWMRFCTKNFRWSEKEAEREEAPPIPPAHERRGDIPSQGELDFY